MCIHEDVQPNSNAARYLLQFASSGPDPRVMVLLSSSAPLHLLQKPSRNSHRKILDYGCGKGAVASYLVQFAGVKYVLGCDIDERCLQEVRRLFL